MNNRNQSIPVNDVTSTEVNKAIQRSLTKAIARHGLGLYIYAGEDLPDSAEPAPCADCGSAIVGIRKKNGELWTPREIEAYSERRYGRMLCTSCIKAAEKALKEATASEINSAKE